MVDRTLKLRNEKAKMKYKESRMNITEFCEHEALCMFLFVWCVYSSLNVDLVTSTKIKEIIEQECQA